MRVILSNRQGLQLAKDTCRRRENHSIDPIQASGFECVECTQNIYGGIHQGMVERAFVAHAGRQVQNNLTPFGRVGDRISIAHISFDKAHPRN